MPSKSKLISLTSFMGIVSSTVALVVGLSACGGSSSNDDATPPPPEPQAELSLTVAGSNQIDVSWVAVDNTVEYKLYRNTSDATNSATLLVTTSPTATEHSDTGLVNGTTYYYWLTACSSADKCDEFYLAASATTIHQIPTAPLLAVAGSDIDITWAVVDNTDNYELYRHTSNAIGSASLIASPINANYLDTGLVNGTSYYYWVKACNANGCSDFSLAASATTPHQIPTVPDLTVVGSDKIDITWTAINNTTHYEIYRHTSNTASSANLIASPTNAHYSNTGLMSKTSYYYWLKACNANGCSDFSPVAFDTTLAQSYSVHAEIGASNTLIKYYTTEAIDFYRTTEKDCDTANYRSCLNATLDQLPENATNNPNKNFASFVDSFITLNNLVNNPQPTYVHWVAGDQTLTTVDLSVSSSPRFSARSGHQAVVLNNEIYVIGGDDGTPRNDVWKSSDDGVSWTTVTASAGFSARNAYQAVVVNNGNIDEIYVIGGFDGTTRKNDVWKSSDGANWTLVTASAGFSTRANHQAVVVNNGNNDEIYVIGGYDGANKNDVWKSSDGANWTLVTASASFSARVAHQAVVVNNGNNAEIYVIGGLDGSFARKKDVWKSSDGATWTEVTDNAAFSARNNHQAVVVNNGNIDEIYVIGGWSGIRLNDVWKSSDGDNWTLVLSVIDADFSARQRHQAVVLNDAIYVIGGHDGDNKNDVWKSNPRPSANNREWRLLRAIYSYQE